MLVFYYCIYSPLIINVISIKSIRIWYELIFVYIWWKVPVSYINWYFWFIVIHIYCCFNLWFNQILWNILYLDISVVGKQYCQSLWIFLITLHLIYFSKFLFLKLVIVLCLLLIFFLQLHILNQDCKKNTSDLLDTFLQLVYVLINSLI